MARDTSIILAMSAEAMPLPLKLRATATAASSTFRSRPRLRPLAATPRRIHPLHVVARGARNDVLLNVYLGRDRHAHRVVALMQTRHPAATLSSAFANA